MARIRYAKTTKRNNKNQPKIAFFHDDNHTKYLTSRNVKSGSSKNKNLVALNEDQKKKSTRITASRRSKTYRFKRSRTI